MNNAHHIECHTLICTCTCVVYAATDGRMDVLICEMNEMSPGEDVGVASGR